jgi:outer membrane protein, protease secretion system
VQVIKLKRFLPLVYFFTTFTYIGNASALGLMEAYEAALANDSVYRSALHENEAGQQFKILGRSNLLPNISANYTYNRVNSDITTSGSGISRDETRNYNSENGAIQLRQPLFNLESWARYQQGNLQTDLSDKQFASRKQELIKRFFGLYANANYAEDVLALSIAERDAFKNQTEANKLMAVRGEGTKTALIESQSQLSLSEAQVIEAQDGVSDGRNALATMLGKEVTNLDALSDGFKVQALEQSDYEAWKNIALENNPEIAAQRETVGIAYQEIRKNRAGHAPKLDAVASISTSKSDSTSTFNQEIDNKSIGLQLNVPIYSGGSVSAATAQAEANHKKAQDDLETKTNEVLLDLRKQYNLVLSSTLKIDALKQSVDSAELLVTATKKSLLGGVRTNLDVLDARKQLFKAQRDLSLARYNYLVAFVSLKKAAGTLSVADLEKIAPNFTPQQRLAIQSEALSD